jgi:subtilisin family serine protease
MDPALRELLRTEPPGREVEAIIRFRRPGAELPGVRVVARFGRVATCRLPVAAIVDVRAHPDVVSLKAARRLGAEPAAEAAYDGGGEVPRRPPGLPLTGAGVVVGAIDLGLDVDHPNFKRPDGSTRLIALWDQRPAANGGAAPQPYGYGTLHTRERLDWALRTADPYEALGYAAADADRGGGAHGTHVMDIAAGSGAIGPAGLAPRADLVFVHLADRDTGGLANLGDSVRLLEAAHFIARAAGDRPWVINISMGRHGGPHDGRTLTELALDELLAAAPGRFVAQSAGNYHESRTHATGVVGPGESTVLRFVTHPADTTPNELEIWYDRADRLTVRIDPPGTTGAPAVPLGGTADILAAGRVAGRIYHRACDPNNGAHHVDAFLHPWAPAGEWRVTIEGVGVHSGRFHAWLERDEACAECQARFVPADASPECTTGTIANGHLPLVVGSYDPGSPFRSPGRSSSAGPTRDGRDKPDLAAPGVGILAARSAPAGSARSPGLLVRKTGTSMATPHVAGAVALCLEYAGHRLDAAEIRRLVLSTVDPPAGGGHRLGRGYLNVPALLAALREHHPPEVTTMDRESVAPLALAPARAYRELLYRPAGDLATWFGDRFSILARPGERVPDGPQAGDVLLHAVLGRPQARGDCVVVTEAGLTRRRRNRPGRPAGWYARTAAPGSAGGSRPALVLDPAGVVPPGRLLVRPRPADPDPPPEPEPYLSPDPELYLSPDPEPDPEPYWEPDDADAAAAGCGCGCSGGSSGAAVRDEESTEDDPADPGAWKGTAEQIDFRARVLAEHIARSRRAKGAAQPDLTGDQLMDVPGTCRTEHGKTTCVKTARPTAEAAGRLLTAANADLAKAQQAGDADAQRTVRLTAASGYRGSDHQRQLWLGYFASKYYNRTRATRAKIADGPHSDAAVDYLLRSKADGGYGVGGRIAAPGYSNHQGGIALDFWQERTRGNAISNDSDDPSRCRWRMSWFHGWLRTHAADHGFQPIPTEEWHWEYRPGVTRSPDLTDHRDGKLWTFASATLPQRVAVFVPKAALGRRDVDVLVFAHGLLKGCTRPKSVPAGFVTDAPFRLGRIVDESGRPVVLVVPSLDWGTPCGEVVFGRGQARRHPLGKPAVLNALVAEVLTQVGRVQKAAAPALRNLVVAGHSRAYDVLEPLAASRGEPAMRQGALARLSEVWAFDTTYAGDVAAWKDWLAQNTALRLRLYYRPGSPTGGVGKRFYDERGDRLLVTQVREGHCAVPATRLAELMPKPAATRPGEDDPPEYPVESADTALDPDLSATLGLEGLDDSELDYSDTDDLDDDSDRDYVDGDVVTDRGTW